jgi:hypothetical protein
MKKTGVGQPYVMCARPFRRGPRHCLLSLQSICNHCGAQCKGQPQMSSYSLFICFEIATLRLVSTCRPDCQQGWSALDATATVHYARVMARTRTGGEFVMISSRDG